MPNRRILIIDHRAYNEAGERTFEFLPDLSSFGNYVEVVGRLDVDQWKGQEDRFKEAYAFVLAHANQSTPELDFLDNDYGAFHVRFHGESATELIEDEYLLLDRKMLKPDLIPFIDHFRSTGQARWQVFVGDPLVPPSQPTGASEGPALGSGEPAVPAGAITFTSERAEAGETTLLIRLTPDNRLDVARTLAPLAEMEEPRWVLLEQDYPSRPRAGIALLLHLRLATFLGPASRFPIAIRLTSLPEDLVRHDPTHAALFARGVTRLDDSAPWPETPPEPVSEEEQEAFIKRAAVPEPDFYGPHDVANDWGAMSLDASVGALQSESPFRMGPWVLRADRLLREPYFWRLLGRLAGTSASPSSSHVGAWKRWTKFLKKFSEQHGRPVRVLCIDDEWGGKWESAYRAALQPEEGLSVMEGYPRSEGDPFLASEALRLATGQEWDVLLLDLRLEPSQEPASSQPDENALAELSGVRFLGQLRPARPTLPIVVTTGSSKAWTYRHLVAQGADGYWVKEHPHMVTRPSDPLDHALILLSEIQDVIGKRERIAYLWQLALMVEERMKKGGWMEAAFSWPKDAPLDKHPSPAAIEDHLKGVVSRIKEAYGHLAFRHEAAHAAVFHLNQPANLAFLALWSSVSELSEVLFRSARGEYYWRDLQGAARRFWTGSKADDTGLSRSESENRDFSPSGGSASTDALLLPLLEGVHDNEERRARIDTFTALRRKRNRLRYTHGTSYTVQSMEEASPYDVKSLARVLQQLLRLD